MKEAEIWLWVGGAGALGLGAVMFTDTGQNALNAVKATAQGALTTRTPQDILDAVEIVNPAGNPELQKGANGFRDWCNKALYLLLTQLGVYMPINTLANDEIQYMAGSSAWTPTDLMGAQAAALQGQVAVATYFNPNGSGHVALVLPID